MKNRFDKRFFLPLFLGLGCLASIGLLAFQAPPAANAHYAYINSAATTAVKGGPGFLHTVTVNGGTAGVVTLYDIGQGGCTGTPASGKFATIETIGSTNPVSLLYDVQVLNGICVVTAAASDVTVSFN